MHALQIDIIFDTHTVALQDAFMYQKVSIHYKALM